VRCEGVPVTVFLTSYSMPFFVSSIKLVKKQKEINKTMCDSVTHTCFLKEDHIPDLVCRDKQGNKGDGVEKCNLDFKFLRAPFKINVKLRKM
jgi:hypothetical protein